MSGLRFWVRPFPQRGDDTGFTLCTWKDDLGFLLLFLNGTENLRITSNPVRLVSL